MPLSQALRKLTEAGLLTALAPRPLPQPIPAQFRMDLHCDYHQGLGHETDRCTALRHAIQDLIDQGATSEPLTFTRYSVQAPYILIPDVEEVRAPHVDISQTPDVQYILRGGRVVRQPPPAAARPVEGTSASQEEVRAEDDEILRQLQSTQARISIWSLLASSSTHRDALTRALSQIRVDTTTTPEGLIHMMTAGRATCIVFSDDDLPPEGSDHTRPLYISVGCSGRRVPSVLLDNGSALNTVRAYDSTRREVMGTLEIELLIGPATFVAIFQVLRIPTSFNLLLGPTMDPPSRGHSFFPSSEGEVYSRWSDRRGAVCGRHVHCCRAYHGDRGFLSGFCGHVLDQHGEHSGARYYAEHVLSTRHGLGRRQHGPSEFIAIPDHDVPFGLGFIPTEADYLYMARLRKERVRA
ncbi:hypothetical protein CK203_029680 [Vitis vinifera]|uniref:Uncharacterized protein n=1 Tax=Vitis vinifera TaxID=29760 RepID=A0A438IIP1_VITVI|nr:hypothetical protein CK203_029680 [Vitis vinifera]